MIIENVKEWSRLIKSNRKVTIWFYDRGDIRGRKDGKISIERKGVYWLVDIEDNRSDLPESIIYNRLFGSIREAAEIVENHMESWCGNRSYSIDEEP